MAEWETATTTVAPGVEREDSISGYSLAGTKEALLASGLAKEEWFWNGRRSSDGRRLRTVKFTIGGNRAKCWPYRDNSGGHVIEVKYSDAEVARRRQARQRDQAAETAKDRLITGLGLTLMAFNVENDPATAWRFTAETVEQVKSHVREVMRLFKAGGFTIRQGSLTEGDTEFQRFMARATSEAGEQRPSAAGAA